EVADRIALFSNFDNLAGVASLKLLDLLLQTSRRHREPGSEQILVGADSRHRRRDGGFQASRRQPLRPPMDKRHDNEQTKGANKQSCGEKSEPEIHKRFDHECRPSRTYARAGPGRAPNGARVTTIGRPLRPASSEADQRY